jgi:hypothetical protein
MGGKSKPPEQGEDDQEYDEGNHSHLLEHIPRVIARDLLECYPLTTAFMTP